jgi:hypothetical protein
MVWESDNGLIAYARFERRSRWPRLSWLGRQLSSWRVAKWLLVSIVLLIDIAMYLQVTRRPATNTTAAPRGVITATPRVVIAPTRSTPSSPTSNLPPERVSMQLQVDGQVQEFTGDWISIKVGTREYLYSAQNGSIVMSTIDTGTPDATNGDEPTSDRSVTVTTPSGAVTLTGDFQLPKLPTTERRSANK